MKKKIEFVSFPDQKRVWCVNPKNIDTLFEYYLIYRTCRVKKVDYLVEVPIHQYNNCRYYGFGFHESCPGLRDDEVWFLTKNQTPAERKHHQQVIKSKRFRPLESV